MITVIFAMMTDYKQYIVPIFNTDYSEGVGFFVGDHLITAAHVICKGQPFIVMNDKKCYLAKEDARLLELYNENSTYDNGLDIAVFSFNGINSPLKFSHTSVDVGAQLVSRAFFRHYSEEFGDALSVEETSGIVTEVMGNFFKCDLNRILRSGSSGSPVFSNDEVVGILCGNYETDPENRILFLSGHVYYELMNKLRK